MRAVWLTEETLDGCDRAKSVGHDPMTRIPLLLDYLQLIFIGASTLRHMSIFDSPSARLSRDCPMSLKRSTTHDYARAFDEDPVDRSPRNRRVSIWALWSNAPRFATSPVNHDLDGT